MSQPGEYEMTSHLPLTRSRTERSTSPTERSTVSHLVTPTTEKVWIQVTEQANESVENVEQTLKRGLEARQVSVRLARCVKCPKFFQISMMALGGVYCNSAYLCQLLACPFNIYRGYWNRSHHRVLHCSCSRYRTETIIVQWVHEFIFRRACWLAHRLCHPGYVHNWLIAWLSIIFTRD